MKASLLIALLGLLFFACSSDTYYIDPVNICGCAADEICVDETCVVPGEAVLDPPEEEEICQSSTLLLNEVRYAGLSFVDFVELRGESGASLLGHQLIAVDSDGHLVSQVSLSGALNEGGLWVGAFGETLEAAADLQLGESGLSSPAGSLQLLGCEGEVLDAISWGPELGAGVRRGEGAPAMGTAGDLSLARCPSELLADADSNDNLSDFLVDAASPGAPNDRVAQAPGCKVCDASVYEDQVILNEVYYDPTGADGDAPAFVELRATAGLDLSEVSLELWDEPIGRWVEVGALEVVTPEDGLVVLSDDEGLAGVDLVFELADGPNDAGGYRLVGCGGVVYDLMLYGAISDPSFADPEGEAPLEDVGDGLALARCPDGEGSFLSQPPSAGEENPCVPD